MIIGSGLIARSLQDIDSQEVLYFASGVSNSLETRDSEFERELNLLKKNIADNTEKKIFYFSTLSIHDQSKQNSQYVLHKLNVENFIQENCKNYLIMRVGNIVGKGGNPNTLFNFLKSKIIENTIFSLHTKARRLFIDIDDIPLFLKKNENLNNKIVNIAFPNYYNLKTIVEAVQKKIGKKGIYEEIEEGDFYKITFCNDITNYFKNISSEEYLQNLVNKYI